LAHHWGIKTFYYSLINKQGSKVEESPQPSSLENVNFDELEDCEACKL
jgi:hypothetical protein